MRHGGHGKGWPKWNLRKEDEFVFRSEDEKTLPWSERMLTQLLERRFERGVRALAPLRVRTMAEMDMRSLTARIEACWQDVERKPLRMQQVQVACEAVLRTIERQADCLGAQEHALCERMLIAGGKTCLHDVQELDAARALSLRLLAHVGLESEQPVAMLEPLFATALENAFSRPEHARIRMRLFSFAATVSAALYLAGVIDDGAPQRLFAQQVLGMGETDEEALQLARQYLWAEFDCVDYEGGVLLLHPAVTEPFKIASGNTQLETFTARELLGGMNGILPQEEQSEEALLRAVEGTLRPGVDAQESVRHLRLLSKQGAPIEALFEVMDTLLMVRRTPRLNAAIEALHTQAVRWCGEEARVCALLQ